MSNATTSAENRYRRACLEAMSKAGMNYYRRLEWFIWSAIKRPCPTCSRPPGAPCVNMTDVKASRGPRQNRSPHDPRIDWPKIYDGLKQRGYIVEN